MKMLRSLFGAPPRGESRIVADERTYRPLEPLADRAARWRREIKDRRRRAIYDRAIASVDAEAYAALQRRYREAADAASDDRAHVKYLDLAPWFMVHSEIALLLDIDRRPRCSILDIGAGGGQFLAIAKAYGHDVLAFDLADPPVYGDLLALFGIDRIIGGVELGRPLPPEIGRFDLVVVNGQVFDVRPGTRERWELPEWAGFIDYLAAHHLALPGELFIGLNRSAGPTGREDYYWPLVDLAEAHGAETFRRRAKIRFRFAAPPDFAEVAAVSWPAPERP